MRFLVERTSFHGSGRPCDEAEKEDYIRIDERTANDPAKIIAFRGETEWWYEKGRNHRVEDNRIKRDFDDKGWFVHLDSLDDFLGFVERHGEIVLGPSFWNSGILSIEIYDSWRE